MALSDSPRFLSKKTKARPLHAQATHWSDRQKLEAVQSWLVTGNLTLTARMLAIPHNTLKDWRKSTWWLEQAAEIKAERKMVRSKALDKIIIASLAAVEDRVNNGDWVLNNKTGEIVRKQVTMKDAHKVAIDLMNKQDLLEPKEELDVKVEDENRLLKLAEKFAELVNKKPEPLPLAERVDGDVVDVTIKEESDALHD